MILLFALDYVRITVYDVCVSFLSLILYNTVFYVGNSLPPFSFSIWLTHTSCFLRLSNITTSRFLFSFDPVHLLLFFLPTSSPVSVPPPYLFHHHSLVICPLPLPPISHPIPLPVSLQQQLRYIFFFPPQFFDHSLSLCPSDDVSTQSPMQCKAPHGKKHQDGSWHLVFRIP